MTAGVIALIVVLIVVTPLGTIWRRRQGQLRAPKATATPAAPDGGRLTAADLRQDLGPKATLVQFSSAFCAPCRGTRQVLGEVARMVPGVAYVEIDAEARLDLVRRLNVLSTPTVLVLGPDGTISKQASGQPRKPDVIAALGEVIPAAPASATEGAAPAVTEATPAPVTQPAAPSGD